MTEGAFLKRIISAFICFVLLVSCSSCSKAPQKEEMAIPNLLIQSDGTARICTESLDITCDWTFNENEEMYLTVLQPADISDTKIYCSAVENKMIVRDMQSDLTENSVFAEIRNAWIALCAAEQATRTSAGWSYSLKVIHGLTAFVSADMTQITLKSPLWSVTISPE